MLPSGEVRGDIVIAYVVVAVAFSCRIAFVHSFDPVEGICDFVWQRAPRFFVNFNKGSAFFLCGAV